MVRSPGKKIAITEEDKAAQKQKIINAAIKVFGSNGYHNSTISQIAEEADMGRGTLYWYFKSKEELFRELIHQFMESTEMQMKAQVSLGGSLEDIVRSIVRTWLDGAANQTELFHIMYSIFGHTHGDFTEEMLAAMKSMYSGVISTIENLLLQAIETRQMRQADAHRLARLLVGLVDGIILQHIFIEPINPEAMTEVVMKLLFRGLKPDLDGAQE